MIRRRELLGGVAGLSALTQFGAAAQPGLPIVGYLSGRTAEAEKPLRAGFLDGLQQAGFPVGRNVAIEYRFSEGRLDLLPALVAELVRLPASVLVALDAVAALAAKKATATVPIVFGSGADPVELGLVASLSRPAGNATGVHVFVTHCSPSAWN